MLLTLCLLHSLIENILTHLEDVVEQSYEQLEVF